eukprot:11081403-Alexandrium_andersonii.AAC.1
MQSGIRPMVVSAAIRLNPQSAMRTMQHRFGRSNPGLHRHQAKASKLAPEAPERCVLCARSRGFRIHPRTRGAGGP